jgi:hypothetical protein
MNDLEIKVRQKQPQERLMVCSSHNSGSCPCLEDTTILANCIRRETFTIDESKQLNLHSTANFSIKFTRVEQKQLSVSI